MLIEKDLIINAKKEFGDRAVQVIAEDLNLERFDEKNKKASCPFGHSDTDPSFIWNDKDACFHCFSCGKNYGILDHYIDHDNLTFLGAVEKLFDETGIKYSFGEKGVKTQRNYVYPSYDKSEDRTQVEEYCQLRKISKQTLDYCDVQESGHSHGNMVFNYYDENDVLTMVKYRPAKKVLKGENKNWSQVGADTRPILFNMNRIDPTKTLLITEGECFPGDAEVLTDDGWLRLDEYNSQRVMSVNDRMEGNIVPPIAYIKKWYEGDLISVNKGGNYHISVTPNHKIAYIDSNGKVVKRAISEMPNTVVGKIPTAVFQGGEGIPLTQEQLALFIAVSADGTLDKRKTEGMYYVRISFQKKRKIERFEEILNSNGIKYVKTRQPSHMKATFFGFVAPQWLNTKQFPHSWIVEMSIEQKQFFLKEIVHWDGNHVNGRNQVEYSSKRYDNATFVQSVAHTSGYMSTIIERSNHLGEWFKVSILLGKDHVSWQNAYRHKHVKAERHIGYVYCVQVPSGMILIRQDNKISVIGNCDAISAIEAGFKNTVSVPFGAQNFKWIEENFDWLEQFDKIIVWSDNDEAGTKMRRESCARLGVWRTFYVDLPTFLEDESGKKWAVKDINEVLYLFGKQKVIDFIENAQEMPIEGVEDMANVEDFDLEKAEGLPPGLKTVNDIIYKFLFKSVLLVTGVKGHGKSTLVNQLFVCNALQQGHDVFMFSGELGGPVLKSWIELTMAGPEKVKMKDDFVHVIDSEARKEMREWYKGRIWIYNENDNEADAILNKAVATTRKYGVKVWIIDNLMTINIGASDENIYQKQKDFIVKLNKYAMLYNVLIVLVTHPRKLMRGADLTTDDIAGSGDLGNLAQYILSVRRFTEDEKQGETDRSGNFLKGREPIDEDAEVRIMKNRYTGKLGRARLYFDYPSYRFYGDPAEYYFRYSWNKDDSPYPRRDPRRDRTPTPFDD
jgi:KaiC/GvpD/RAD55 family RecA-like ATPase